MGMDIRWDLIGQPVDIGARFREGMEFGRQQRERRDLQQAAMTLSENPDDPHARRVMSALNPQALYAMEDAAYQRGERQRTGEFRSALADYTLQRTGSPATTSTDSAGINALGRPPMGAPAPVAGPMAPGSRVNALAGAVAALPGEGGAMAPNALLGNPAAPVGADPVAGAPQAAPAPRGRRPAYEDTAAWRRMVQADPPGAMAARASFAKITKDELDVHDAVNDQSLEMLGTVHDQASYDAAKERARAMYQQYGLDGSMLDALPAEYRPEVIQGLRMQAMESKDLLAALRAERRLDWDIEDDELDNDRAERTFRSQDEYRRGMLRNSTTRANRAPAPRGASRQPSKSAVVGGILQKQASGKPLTPAEQQVLQEHGGGRENYPNGTIIEMPDGSIRERKNGRWVASNG